MRVSAADYHIKYNPKHTDSPAVTDMLPLMSENWNTVTYQRFGFKEDRSAENDKETRQRHTFSMLTYHKETGLTVATYIQTINILHQPDTPSHLSTHTPNHTKNRFALHRKRRSE